MELSLDEGFGSSQWSTIRAQSTASDGTACCSSAGAGKGVTVRALPGSVWGDFGKSCPAPNLFLLNTDAASAASDADADADADTAAAAAGAGGGAGAGDAGAGTGAGAGAAAGNHRCAVEATVSFEPRSFGEQAGVWWYHNDDNWVKLVIEVRCAKQMHGHPSHQPPTHILCGASIDTCKQGMKEGKVSIVFAYSVDGKPSVVKKVPARYCLRCACPRLAKRMVNNTHTAVARRRTYTEAQRLCFAWK